jgi:hypothetical protein
MLQNDQENDLQTEFNRVVDDERLCVIRLLIF